MKSIFDNNLPLWLPIVPDNATHFTQLQGVLKVKNKWKGFRINECQFIKLKNEEEHKFIDLYNAQLERIDEISFRLYKNQESMHFKAINKDTCDDWYDALFDRIVHFNFDYHFQINGLLGVGHFGTVFKVTQRCDNKEFCMKCFEKSNFKAIDEQAIRKELQIVRILKHIPNSVQLKWIFENQYAMIGIGSIMYGGNLREYTKHNKLSEWDQAYITQSLLKTLLQFKKINLMHRDIKLDNIILRKQQDIRDPVICDFGLAEYYHPKQQYLFRKCGTPGYAAPEMLSGRKYDFKVDVYSVGCVLFRLAMNGKCPFKGDTEDQLYEYNQLGIVNFEGFKKGVTLDFLKLLLQEEPKDRPTAEEALNHRFFDILK